MSGTSLFGNSLAKPKLIVAPASTAGTYPDYAPVSGATFTTVGTTIYFSGVRPNVDVKGGDYIYSSVKTQVRKIDNIKVTGNSFVGILDEPFISDVASEPVKIIRDPKYRGIKITVTGVTTNAIVDGGTITLLAGQLSIEAIDVKDNNGLEPIAYNSGTSILLINITK